jgi:hypothetical protein
MLSSQPPEVSLTRSPTNVYLYHVRTHKLTRSLFYHSLRISSLLHLSLRLISSCSPLSTAFPNRFSPLLSNRTLRFLDSIPAPLLPLARRPRSHKPKPGSKRCAVKPTRPSPSSSSVTSSTSPPPLAGRTGSSPKRTPRKKGCCL